MSNSVHNDNQDIDPQKLNEPECLPAQVWNRLSDRSKIPRRLWFPPKRRLDLDADEWQRQNDDVSISLRRTMISMLGYSFFCMLTLAAPDVSLIAKDARIIVPFAGTEVSYQSFLLIGPLPVFAIAIYIHILLGHWLSLGKHEKTLGLPYIFNIDNKTANCIANFIFYWLPCLVLSYFSWKALPRPTEARLLIIQTTIFFSCMVVLRIRRLSDNKHRLKFTISYLFLCLLGVCLLSWTQLGFYQRNLYLFRADLRKKDLRNVYLYKANFEEADLGEANLAEAYLQKVNLRKATLTGTKLWKANLSEADLSGANLSGANMSGADMSKVNLSEADLSEAILEYTNLSGANLSGVDLLKTSLLKVDLSGADLSQTNLLGIDLSGSNLSRAKLGSVNLSNADLSYSNLSATNLSKADLQSLCANEGETLTP